MSKEKMITRTIERTEAIVIALDVITVETQILSLVAMGTYENDRKLLEALKRAHETDTFKIVAIQSSTLHQDIYGATEREFMSIARLLDPDTRKPIE